MRLRLRLRLPPCNPALPCTLFDALRPFTSCFGGIREKIWGKGQEQSKCKVFLTPKQEARRNLEWWGGDEGDKAMFFGGGA
jgi:hypothetical protein